MRAEKESIVAEIQRQVSGAEYFLVADYRGMTVERMTDLRAQLRPVQTQVRVVSNAFLKRALQATGCAKDVESYLEGPTVLVSGTGDITKVAKILKTFRSEGGLPVVRGGWMAQRTLRAEDVAELADIPPREVLLGQFVGTLAAPMTRLAGVLRQKVGSIVYVLQATARKKSG